MVKVEGGREFIGVGLVLGDHMTRNVESVLIHLRFDSFDNQQYLSTLLDNLFRLKSNVIENRLKMLSNKTIRLRFTFFLFNYNISLVLILY